MRNSCLGIGCSTNESNTHYSSSMHQKLNHWVLFFSLSTYTLCRYLFSKKKKKPHASFIVSSIDRLRILQLPDLMSALVTRFRKDSRVRGSHELPHPTYKFRGLQNSVPACQCLSNNHDIASQTISFSRRQMFNQKETTLQMETCMIKSPGGCLGPEIFGRIPA